jgi:L-alanine-DL-glutamate epimerase-like enolase superfamily enzyme
MRLNLYRLDIPFKQHFKHSSADRAKTESVWVEARGNGCQGFGEGCPRSYVTGEDLASAKAFFGRHADTLSAKIGSVEDLKRWVDDHREDIDRNPAVCCAMELAILELLARCRGVSVEELLGLRAVTELFRYSAVIGDGLGAEFRLLARRFGDSGFTDFKIKLSGKLASDREKMAILDGLGLEGLHVRVDANNLWDRPRTAARYITEMGRSLVGALVGIEEPIAVGQFDAMRQIWQETGIPIILDESLLRSEEIAALADDPQCWIINVRVSKMGGLIRSLKLVGEAEKAGIPVIVGAQVGETSLLTRAGLIVAEAAGTNLYGHEGAFGTLLLKSDVVTPPLMFGGEGILDSGAWRFASKSGWGLTWTFDDDIRRPL